MSELAPASGQRNADITSFADALKTSREKYAFAAILTRYPVAETIVACSQSRPDLQHFVRPRKRFRLERRHCRSRTLFRRGCFRRERGKFFRTTGLWAGTRAPPPGPGTFCSSNAQGET